MIYLEHTPSPPLRRYVRMLWLAQAPAAQGRQRVLPTGRVQVIFNLARDFILDCPEGEDDRRVPPSLIVGARSIYEVVDTSDMADLAGIVFEPGGFARFAHDAADLFSNRTLGLEDLCGSGARTVRDRLCACCSTRERFRILENFLVGVLARGVAGQSGSQRGSSRDCAVAFALDRFGRAPSVLTVREVARSIGWSERHLSQVFREEVGFSPKVWCRIQRFQRAVGLLHAGGDVRWSELALDCGFYDQSHFANEFRAFSGVDATTYSALRTPWANHIAVP